MNSKQVISTGRHIGTRNTLLTNTHTNGNRTTGGSQSIIQVLVRHVRRTLMRIRLNVNGKITRKLLQANRRSKLEAILGRMKGHYHNMTRNINTIRSRRTIIINVALSGSITSTRPITQTRVNTISIRKLRRIRLTRTQSLKSTLNRLLANRNKKRTITILNQYSNTTHNSRGSTLRTNVPVMFTTPRTRSFNDVITRNIRYSGMLRRLWHLGALRLPSGENPNHTFTIH